MTDYNPIKVWDVIDDPCHNSNDGLATSKLK